jgi:hypothetical protein
MEELKDKTSDLLSRLLQKFLGFTPTMILKISFLE